MSERFSRNKLKIRDIYDKFNSNEWIVDQTYQRRKVWVKKDNIRLIETILLGLVIPEIFIWDYDTDPNSGKTITHIVDGQQRIYAIFEFISDGFELTERYLLDDEIKKQFAGKKFSGLPDSVKKSIWRYELSIVNLDGEFSKQEVQNMFYRLNLTDYSLTDQEKRNSTDSAFGRAAEELADHDFWGKHKIFSARDIRRMGDVEYCSNILVLCREGIIDQTKQDKLDQMYQDYSEEYADKKKDYDKTIKAMNIIDELTSGEIDSFSNKKLQMYTLFSLAFTFIDDGVEIDKDIKQIYEQFVKAYNVFKNEYDFNIDKATESRAFEMIKKYKLASSEGVNKLTNRMIRFEVLQKILLNIDNISIDDLKSIEEKCRIEANKNA